MARIKVRFLVAFAGAAGELPRYFWQPSGPLRQQGWAPRRVPVDWARYRDSEALRLAAIAAAEAINAELDRVRAADRGNRQAPARALAQQTERTLTGLIQLYRGVQIGAKVIAPPSKEFARLAPTTRKGYEQCLERIEAWGGTAAVRAIDAERVTVLLDSMERTPAFRNAVARVLRLLLEFGRRKGWLTVNPALRPNLGGAAPSGLIWPRAAIAAIVAAADAMGLHSIGTAVMLNEWLGQRQADILRMPRSIYRNGALVIRQKKVIATTGVAVTLPVDMVPHLQLRLEAELARNQAREDRGGIASTAILICERTGQPWQADHFHHTFAAVRALAAAGDAKRGLAPHPSFALDYLRAGRDMVAPDAFSIEMRELWFMHLRHTAVVRLAEAGCDVTLISAITGHSLVSIEKILKHYLIRTAVMARLAFQKRLDAEGLALPAPAKKEEA